jgi:hypothetical protein
MSNLHCQPCGTTSHSRFTRRTWSERLIPKQDLRAPVRGGEPWDESSSQGSWATRRTVLLSLGSALAARPPRWHREASIGLSVYLVHLPRNYAWVVRCPILSGRDFVFLVDVQSFCRGLNCDLSRSHARRDVSSVLSLQSFALSLVYVAFSKMWRFAFLAPLLAAGSDLPSGKGESSRDQLKTMTNALRLCVNTRSGPCRGAY